MMNSRGKLLEQKETEKLKGLKMILLHCNLSLDMKRHEERKLLGLKKMKMMKGKKRVKD